MVCTCCGAYNPKSGFVYYNRRTQYDIVHNTEMPSFEGYPNKWAEHGGALALSQLTHLALVRFRGC